MPRRVTLQGFHGGWHHWRAESHGSVIQAVGLHTRCWYDGKHWRAFCRRHVVHGVRAYRTMCLGDVHCLPMVVSQHTQRLACQAEAETHCLGVQVGLMASVLAAFFLSLEMLLVQMVDGKTTSWHETLLSVGAATVRFSFLALFFIPVMLIAGYGYAAINYAIIKKSFHPLSPRHAVSSAM